MKIAITNNIALNGGDAAIMLGMTKALRKRFGNDTKFVISSTYPEVCAELYPEYRWISVIGREADTTPYNHIRFIGRIARYLKHSRYYIAAYFRKNNIPLYKLLLCKHDIHTLNEYATSDYIISSGGTYLIEPYGIDAQYHDYRISLILGKPLVQYSQSMGPFTRKQTKERLRWIFNRCNTILLRDQKSAANVLGLGIKDESIVHVVPDAAFALGDVEAMMSRKDDTMNKYGNVAISVRDWIHTTDDNTMPKYLKSIAEAIIMLVKKGYKIHFISTCQGIPYYSDDNQEVEKIMSLIPVQYHSNIVKYNHYLSIPTIQNLLHTMDFIIATRLHMSILSLITGTPVYPIAYEFKTVELYHSLGYNRVDTLDSLSPTTFCNSIDAFIEWFTTTRRQKIYSRVVEYINNSMSVPTLIK